MNYRLSIYAILAFAFLFYSCTSNPLDVKLPKDEINIDFINVDQSFHQKPIDSVKIIMADFEDEIGELFLYELSKNIRENITDSSYKTVYNFYSSEYISDLENEKSKIYSEITKHEKRIIDGFKYLKYHFGDSLIPETIFYINKLFSQITCSENQIAVGLESYISPQSKVIQSIPKKGFYQWQRDRMDIQYLERDVLLNWIQVQLFDELDSKLAEHIVQAGKILYVLKAVFPKEEDRYILRYNNAQYQWAIDNEKMVWDYLVKQQMLFKSELQTRTNFLNEGPTTVGLSSESPDRIGQFLGYRIVKAFMAKNKALSLPELLNTKYNTVLQAYEID
ncbi:gliding motility lipoprotein GldB [Brumimicrobium aurantiacum]|uniref:Gliding motility lipoprotein GldB n=1 Tax=Brumimicrobium aurantiacum TaxID=1737063 RepID=A0A3E1EV80_9FLAO|nr:hypothetical protein [Brumimicrobium aurantiacum]RFC53428.1 hypothetical protein DXU93_13435 [Brumimicrobium aurantiacum]